MYRPLGMTAARCHLRVLSAAIAIAAVAVVAACAPAADAQGRRCPRPDGRPCHKITEA
jgi:hypothetical protein